MGRHFEAAQLQQSQAAGGGIWRIQLVDAELGTMCVAAHVHEDVAEEAIHEPRRAASVARCGHLTESDSEFVKAIFAGFIHARRLAGGSDEEA